MLTNSQTIQYSREGTLLACAGRTSVSILDVEGERPTRIEQTNVAAVALFADEVWTLDSTRCLLRRWNRNGVLLGAPQRLPSPCAGWSVTPIGSPALLIESEGRYVMLSQESATPTSYGALYEDSASMVASCGGVLEQNAIQARGVTIPIDGRRYVLCQEPVVYVGFGSGVRCRLREGVKVLGGSVVFDGATVVLVVEDPRRALGAIVLDLASGRASRQFPLPPSGGGVRIAGERGLLIMQTSERRLRAFDVRTGEPHTELEAPMTFDDYALDPAATRIALRSGDVLQVHSFRDLSARSRPEIHLALDAPISTPGARPPQPSQLTISLAAPPRSKRDAEGDAQASVAPLAAAVGTTTARFASTTPTAPTITPTRPTAVIVTPTPISAMSTDAPPPPPPPPTVGGSSTPAPSTPRTSPPGTPSASTPSMPPTSARSEIPRSASRPTRVDDPAVPGLPSLASRTIGTQGEHMPVDPYPPEPPVIPLVKLRGFGAAPKKLAMPRQDAARILSRELHRIDLRTLLAIAKGWDSGRIGYANEGRLPHEHEAFAITGMNEGNALDQLHAARTALDQHEQSLASDPDRHADSTPLGALVAEFNLSPLAADILLVVAAASLRGETGRLYRILSHDASRALVDESLVHQILGHDESSRNEIAHELEPAAPLCRYGLIDVGRDRQRPFASLTVDPVVLARLRAEPVDFGPGAVTSVRAADRDLSELLVPPDLVRDAMRYLARKPTDAHQARIAVRGPMGTGRRSLLAALAARAGRELGVVDAACLPRQADAFLDALRTELRRALLRGLVPCLTRLEDVELTGDDSFLGLVRDVLRCHPGPLAVRLAPRAKVPLDPGHLLLDLTLPTESERLHVWREALGEYRLPVDRPEALAARYRVGLGTIRTVVQSVADDRAEQGQYTGDALADIEKRIRQSREVGLGEHARRIERLPAWSSLVLPDDIMDSLHELLGRVRHRRTVYERWGFGDVVSTSRGLTALFEGQPGTGKTLVAGAIARELGLDLYQIELSKVMSKWLGESEKHLGSIFDAAEDGQVILLFDEADSLFAKRSEVKGSNDRYANLSVNYLLQRLDSFEGFAILTTNFGASIDPAFKRRLSFRLQFPFPDEDQREQLWRVHIPATVPIAGALDLWTLARKFKMSGGYIHNACLRAAFLAAEEDAPLSQAHLERAVALEFAEMGKLSTSGSIE